MQIRLMMNLIYQERELPCIVPVTECIHIVPMSLLHCARYGLSIIEESSSRMPTARTRAHSSMASLRDACGMAELVADDPSAPVD